jgi:hypothetical protein
MPRHYVIRPSFTVGEYVWMSFQPQTPPNRHGDGEREVDERRRRSDGPGERREDQDDSDDRGVHTRGRWRGQSDFGHPRNQRSRLATHVYRIRTAT